MVQPQSLTNFKSLTALRWGVEMKLGVTEEERREARLFPRQTGVMVCVFWGWVPFDSEEKSDLNAIAFLS